MVEMEETNQYWYDEFEINDKGVASESQSKSFQLASAISWGEPKHLSFYQASAPLQASTTSSS